MSEEKRIILSLLEKGAITTDEALELLNAIEEPYGESNNANTKYSNSSEKTQDLSEKMKLLEAKIARKATSFTEKIMDKIEKAIDNGFIEKHLKNYNKFESNIIENIDGINTLKFLTRNGKISINKSDDDKIKLKVIYHIKSKNNLEENEIYKINKNNYIFEFTQTYFNNILLNLEISLPEKHYDKIIAITSNGSIKVKNIVADSISLETKNGKITMENVSSNIIKPTTTNASVTIKDIKANYIKINTTNGKIIVDNALSDELITASTNASIYILESSTKILSSNTKNATITLDKIKTNNLEDVKLFTTNGSVLVNLDNNNKDINFNLTTNNGKIYINEQNIIYKVNLKNKVIALTNNFDNEYKLELLASTTNGDITIN